MKHHKLVSAASDSAWLRPWSCQDHSPVSPQRLRRGPSSPYGLPCLSRRSNRSGRHRLQVNSRQNDVSAKVRYPVADAGDGHMVTIQDANAGTRYACFGCGAAMVARQGTQRAWHFAHKTPLRECADPDRALHETAKAMILQGFTEALTQRSEYRAGFCCEDCGTKATWNIARRRIKHHPRTHRCQEHTLRHRHRPRHQGNPDHRSCRHPRDRGRDKAPL